MIFVNSNFETWSSIIIERSISADVLALTKLVIILKHAYNYCNSHYDMEMEDQKGKSMIEVDTLGSFELISLVTIYSNFQSYFKFSL